MRIVLEPSMDEFCSNELLLQMWTPRELEAMYELLEDRGFGRKVAEYLARNNLVDLVLHKDIKDICLLLKVKEFDG
jgi:hypothetical protein